MDGGEIRKMAEKLTPDRPLARFRARCRLNRGVDLDRVADFLEMRRGKWDQMAVMPEKNHARDYDFALRSEDAAFLRQSFRQPNEALFNMVGESYPWNN
jgi:hypothetical protein